MKVVASRAGGERMEMDPSLLTRLPRLRAAEANEQGSFLSLVCWIRYAQQFGYLSVRCQSRTVCSFLARLRTRFGVQDVTL